MDPLTAWGLALALLGLAGFVAVAVLARRKRT